MYVCAPRVLSTLGGWERAEVILELELKMAMNCHMVAGTLTQDLWKISQSSNH